MPWRLRRLVIVLIAAAAAACSAAETAETACVIIPAGRPRSPSYHHEPAFAPASRTTSRASATGASDTRASEGIFAASRPPEMPLAVPTIAR